MNEFTQSTKALWKSIIEKGDEAFVKAQEKGDDPWNIDGMVGAQLYKIYFAELLSGRKDVAETGYEFDEWAQERKNQGKSTFALDLFGGAYAFEDLANVDGIWGVRLKNIDENLEDAYQKQGKTDLLEKLKRLMNDSKRKIFEGNLFNISTWLSLKKELEESSVKEIDLVFCAPVGGLNEQVDDTQVTDSKELFFQLFKKVYSILSSDDGTILLKLPTKMKGIELDFIEFLKDLEGITVEQHSSLPSAYKIVKGNQAPARLNLDIFNKV